MTTRVHLDTDSMNEGKERKPDSDFLFRIVRGYEGRRLTWHSLECATGKNARYAKRTAYASPEARREAIKANNVAKGYHESFGNYYTDHLAKCCIGRPDATESASPTFTTAQARRIFKQAHDAGMAAGTAHTPTPMIVGTPTPPFGNDIDYSKRTYHVPSGLCGFAWVVIRPGNSSLARQAKKLGIGGSAYGGGVSIWIHEHGQSYECKQKHAHAYARVLSEHGVDAYAQSRLD